MVQYFKYLIVPLAHKWYYEHQTTEENITGTICIKNTLEVFMLLKGVFLLKQFTFFLCVDLDLQVHPLISYHLRNKKALLIYD